MRIVLKHTAIILSLFYLITGQVMADHTFKSAKLREVYSLLPDMIKKQIVRPTAENSLQILIDATIIVPGQSVTVRFGRKNQIDHIGLRLIYSKPGDPYQEAYDYIERTLLSFVLLKDKAKIMKKMDEEQFQIKFDNQELPASRIGSVLSSINFDQTVRFQLDNNPENFVASWYLKDSDLLQAGFTNSYPVICGRPKDEIEQEIMAGLQEHMARAVQNDDVNKNILELSPDGIYIKKGKELPDYPQINSDSYYILNNDGTYKPVYNKKYFKESAVNIFQNLVPTNQKIALTQKLYGNREGKYSLALNGFLDYFSDHYTIYFGWQRDAGNDMVASIFFKNQIYNFIHLLIIKTDADNILNKNSTLAGTFYTFIPQNFISL